MENQCFSSLRYIVISSKAKISAFKYIHINFEFQRYEEGTTELKELYEDKDG